MTLHELGVQDHGINHTKIIIKSSSGVGKLDQGMSSDVAMKDLDDELFFPVILQEFLLPAPLSSSALRRVPLLPPPRSPRSAPSVVLR